MVIFVISKEWVQISCRVQEFEKIIALLDPLLSTIPGYEKGKDNLRDDGEDCFAVLVMTQNQKGNKKCIAGLPPCSVLMKFDPQPHTDSVSGSGCP